MRKLLISVLFILVYSTSWGQFTVDKLRLRIGYNLHNTNAKRFNHLIDQFNNQRYPQEISDNLGGLNWMFGMVGGADYVFSESIILHAVLKSRRQFIETPYANIAMFRSYLFRQHTLELSASMILLEEKWFNHSVGAGFTFGVLGVFTNWAEQNGYPGARNMVNIDHTASVGLSLNYEAQLKLHDNLRLFIRPVAQFALESHVRRLSDFFEPQIIQGNVTYGEGLDEKYDNGTLNGLGIEGGLLILLPQF